MPDRNNVIRLIEEEISVCESVNQCYRTVDLPTLRDILALLKEQEAVKPVPPEDEFGLYRCGKCYSPLFRCVDKYCSRCGQAVKWD